MRFLSVHVSPKPSMVSSDDYQATIKMMLSEWVAYKSKLGNSSMWLKAFFLLVLQEQFSSHLFFTKLSSR